MRYILILLLLVSTAYGQSSPTSAKTRFVNGLYVGTKLDSYFAAADSNAIYWRADSVVMAKYKGTARALAFAVSGGYIPYSDTTSLLSQVVRTFGTQTVGGRKTFSNDITVNGATIGLGGGGNSGSVAIGVSALTATTNGTTPNIAIGNSALKDLTTGAGNIGIGSNVINGATTGSNSNVIVGHNSLSGVTSGDNNTTLGNIAGRLTAASSTVTSINSSVFIGANTKPSATTGVSNETVLGFNATGNGSNTVTIGNSSVTGNYFNGFLKQTSVTSAMLKASSTGVLEAAVAGTDYVAPSALSGYLPLSGGTLTGNLIVGNNTTGRNVNIYASSYGNNGLFQAYGTDNALKLQMGGLGANEAFLFTGASNKITVYSGGVVTATFNSDQTTTLSGALNGTSLSMSGNGFFGGTSMASISNPRALIIQNPAGTDFVLGIKGGTTTGSSYGPFIQAGTNSSDISLLVRDVNNVTDYLKIRGNGVSSFSENLLIKTTTDNGTDALQVAGSGLFTVSSGTNLVLSKPSGAALQFDKTTATAQSWSINPDDDFKIYDVTGSNTIRLQIAKTTGAAAFSSSITASSLSVSGLLQTSNRLYVNGNTNISSWISSALTAGYDATNSNGWVNADGALVLGTGGTERFRIASTGAATFNSLAGTGDRLVQASSTGVLTATQAIASGTYTPTLSNSTNVTSSTVRLARYTRIGNVVTVYGQVDVVLTSTGLTEFQLSLPVSSDIVNNYELSGSGTCEKGGAYPSVRMTGNTTNNTAYFDFTSASSGNGFISYTFSYTVQ